MYKSCEVILKSSWRVVVPALLLTIVLWTIPSFGQSGTALQFNANGPDQGKQFVNLGPNVKLGDPAINGGAFTIETWFRREGMGGYSMEEYPNEPQTFAVPLVGKGGYAGGPVNYFLGVDWFRRVLVADFTDINTGAGHPVYGTTVISDDKWYHAAAVYDGSTWYLYLDGQLEATLAVGMTPSYNSTANTSLGASIGDATVLRRGRIPVGFKVLWMKCASGM